MKKGRGYVYKLEYHLIWVTKYRHQVLVGEVADGLKDILRDIAAQNGLEIITMEVMPDHVHLLLSATPQHAIPDFVKALKGASARRMFSTFPQLKQKLWGGNLWNPSYCILTVSENTRAQVQHYIESQSSQTDAPGYAAPQHDQK
ncbi:IS200/IS605 family transposase [Deinococcus marmoris]|uniref:Mobile element protein n=1 Tax=Deinococcus marmoris TaxID=249408 RepID=A0A1U7P4A6_9DEIO|nr:IS200/IS605 family transposase [Deinococcus marmoris]OLV20007.1 Mobile element protein [Deinococcus marmoris]